MDIPAELLANFMSITNAPEPTALQLLRDAQLDLESAIQSYYAIEEAGGLNPPSPEQPPPSPPRAPIPQVVDTLLPTVPERPAALPTDPFAADGTTRGDGLAAMYRRPTHLNCSGSFDQAMRRGVAQKRWLLVNIQRSDEFSCHMINRDVWADGAVEEVVQAHFIFWQREETSSDGARYKQFYPYERVPHVAIVDPRSGERLRVWGGDGEVIGKAGLLEGLEEFVGRFNLESDERVGMGGGASTRRDEMREEEEVAKAIEQSLSNGQMDVERETRRLMSATDPNMNAARRLRMEQDDEFEESLMMDRAREESEKVERERVERVQEEERRKKEKREMKRRRVPEVSEGEGKTCELVIRLPDGKRLQKRFLASHCVGLVYDYIEGECEELEEGKFVLMQAYPKRTFGDREEPLEVLAPKAALVVHLVN